MHRFPIGKDRNIITGPPAYIFVMQAVLFQLFLRILWYRNGDRIWKRIEIYGKTEECIRCI